jgi:hypothetical protein
LPGLKGQGYLFWAEGRQTMNLQSITLNLVLGLINHRSRSLLHREDRA